MGDEVANTLMEHLPPFGWADVARKSDVDQLQRDISRVEISLSADINRVEKRIDHLVAGMWAMGSLMVTGFIGIFTLIATKL